MESIYASNKDIQLNETLGELNIISAGSTAFMEDVIRN